MRIFKSKWFERFARKNGIGDAALKEMVSELERGIWDADYGGNVYKKRIARQGKGKRGGYRTFVVFKSEKITQYVYAFAKSSKEAIDDLDEKQKRKLKERAKDILSLTDEKIQARIEKGTLVEVV